MYQRLVRRSSWIPRARAAGRVRDTRIVANLALTLNAQDWAGVPGTVRVKAQGWPPDELAGRGIMTVAAVFVVAVSSL